jgi:hypothetical protein
LYEGQWNKDLDIKLGVGIYYLNDLIIGKHHDDEMVAITYISEKGEYIVKHEQDSNKED